MVSVSSSLDQWDRIKTCKYDQMIVERAAKVQRRIVNLFKFSTNRIPGHPHTKKMNL